MLKLFTQNKCLLFCSLHGIIVMQLKMVSLFGPQSEQLNCLVRNKRDNSQCKLRGSA